MARRKRYLPRLDVVFSRRDRNNGKPLLNVAAQDMEASIEPRAVAAINQDIEATGRVRAGDISGKIGHDKMIYQKITDVVISDSETPVAHTLGVVPLYYHFVVKGTGYVDSAPDVWQTRPPDATAVYLQASATAHVDIIVRG